MESAPEIDYSAVLADLKKRRDDLDKAIAGIEQLIGLPASSAPDANSAETVDGDKVGKGVRIPLRGTVKAADSPLPSSGPIPSDAFFGMSIAQATQKFLTMRKKPATAPEIAEALEQGGLPHQSSRLPNTVNSVLTRNSVGAAPIFAKVKRGTWGLRAWYPNYRPKDEKDDA